MDAAWILYKLSFSQVAVKILGVTYINGYLHKHKSLKLLWKITGKIRFISMYFPVNLSRNLLIAKKI